jgi:hypothetical protein
MKRKVHFIYTLFGLFAYAGLFLNDASGRKGGYSGAPGDVTCATGGCHIDHTHDPLGGVSLTGAPASFTAGQSYPLTLTIKDAQAVTGGFQIVATNNALTNNVMYGTFTAGTGSQIASTTGASPLRLTHTSPKPFAGGFVSWTFNWKAPATGSGVRFYFAGNASNGDLDETVGDVIYTSNVLTVPIELMSFVGKSANKTVELTWKTASERNNRVFEIERLSVGSTDKFEKIGEVKGFGNTIGIKTYQFVDDAPQADNINYYRLRQVDLDGTSTLSKVISIALGSAIKGFNVYPTFVTRGSTLTIDAPNDAATTFDIIDITGRTVQSIKKAAHTEGVKLSTFDLPTGRYFIRSTGGLMPQTHTFIVF